MKLHKLSRGRKYVDLSEHIEGDKHAHRHVHVPKHVGYRIVNGFPDFHDHRSFYWNRPRHKNVAEALGGEDIVNESVVARRLDHILTMQDQSSVHQNGLDQLHDKIAGVLTDCYAHHPVETECSHECDIAAEATPDTDVSTDDIPRS